MKTSHQQLKLNSAASTGTINPLSAENDPPICEKCRTKHWPFRLCPIDNKPQQSKQLPASPPNPPTPPYPPQKFKPTCKLCGRQHWPLDPSCIGKKAARAEAKARAKAEKKARAEAKANAKARARAAAKPQITVHSPLQEPHEYPARTQTQQPPTPDPLQRVTKQHRPTPQLAEPPTTIQAAALSQISAGDIMQTGILWAAPDYTVAQALADMRLYDADYIIVGRDGLTQGIVSKSDIKAALSPYLRPQFAKWCRPLDEATLQIKIKWIMSTPVRTLTAEASLPDVIQNMQRFRIRCVPVTDRHNIVQGLVTVNDVFQAMLNYKARPKESAPASQIHTTSPQPTVAPASELVTNSP